MATFLSPLQLASNPRLQIQTLQRVSPAAQEVHVASLTYLSSYSHSPNHGTPTASFVSLFVHSEHMCSLAMASLSHPLSLNRQDKCPMCVCMCPCPRIDLLTDILVSLSAPLAVASFVPTAVRDTRRTMVYHRPSLGTSSSPPEKLQSSSPI